MKTKILLSILAISLFVSAFGQNTTMELSFTAIDNETYVQLEAFKVINRSQGDVVAYFWPDTTLVLNYMVETPEISNGENEFQVFQNYPNPLTDQTTISLFIPEKETVNIIITDLMGRVILQSDKKLDKGIHSFRFTPGEGNLFFFIAKCKEKTSSIKILQSGPTSDKPFALKYLGANDLSSQFKATKNTLDLDFSIGDTLLYIGFFNGLQSGIVDAPEESQTYTFQFATNIPCPGTPVVEYAGQTYNTIQIFSQCWLKENLNVGTMIAGTIDMTNNELIEKYCYNNNTDSCSKYGGLYQWDEMMQYSTQQGTGGICPSGWHIPSGEELKVLAGSVDSQNVIGSPIWDPEGWLGFDAADQLKTTTGWYGSWNGSDNFGFSGKPGGLRSTWNGFIDIGVNASWFTSSEANSDKAWGYHFHGGPLSWFRYTKTQGFSVRCKKDN